MPNPQIRHLDSTHILTIMDDLANAYQIAYSDDPDIGHSIYAREAFVERTSAQAKSPGFKFVAAYNGDQMAGFSFGLPFSAGRWWRGDSDTEPPPGIANSDKFAVIELAILPEFRSQGLATRLMRSLLDDRPEPYATLLADQHGHARSIYERWGWRAVQRLRPAPDVPPLDVLVRPAGTLDVTTEQR